jgi:hypothetical protein
MYKTMMFHKTILIEEIINQLIEWVITGVEQKFSQIQLP